MYICIKYIFSSVKFLIVVTLRVLSVTPVYAVYSPSTRSVLTFCIFVGTVSDTRSIVPLCLCVSVPTCGPRKVCVWRWEPGRRRVWEGGPVSRCPINMWLCTRPSPGVSMNGCVVVFLWTRVERLSFWVDTDCKQLVNETRSVIRFRPTQETKLGSVSG